MALSVKPLSEALGAEISGVDLSEPVDEGTFNEILDSFYQYQLLRFPEQTLTAEQHIAFSRRFGDLEIHICEQYLLPGYPEILLLTNELKEDGTRVSIADGGSGWHSDLSYLERPSMGALLYAVQTPQKGGDTEWANMYTAYETLPDETKKRIKGLKAIHQFDQRLNPRLPDPDLRYRDEHSDELRALTPDVQHPIVRTHPVTGRKVLFASVRFTIGVADMDEKEGAALLDELLAHQENPELTYHHKWKMGDLMMWDNRCTNHRACGEVVQFPDVRRLHRATLLGDVPF